MSVSGGRGVLATQLSARHLPEVLRNVHAFRILIMCGISDDCSEVSYACPLRADLFTSVVRGRGLQGVV
jgi:hypothetical protein